MNTNNQIPNVEEIKRILQETLNCKNVTVAENIFHAEGCELAPIQEGGPLIWEFTPVEGGKPTSEFIPFETAMNQINEICGNENLSIFASHESGKAIFCGNKAEHAKTLKATFDGHAFAAASTRGSFFFWIGDAMPLENVSEALDPENVDAWAFFNFERPAQLPETAFPW